MIIHALTKLIKQSLLPLHLHFSMCVYTIVCLSRCVPGHAECTAMFISEYHSQARWTTWWESGITAICSSAARWVPSLWFCCYMFPSFCTHAVCNFVMQTDPSKQLVMWQHRDDDDDEMFGVFTSVISNILWLDAEFYYYLYKSDNFSVLNLTAFCFGVFVGPQLQPRAVLHHLPKFRIMTQLCVSPTCWTASKKSTTFQFIILIHKQSLMFMAGVVTCLWQHYVCFTTPLSSQV